MFNVPTLLIPGVQIQVKLNRSKSEFYLLGTQADPKAVFKFTDAVLYVRHVKSNPSILIAHTQALKKANARYDVTKVALKTFTFGSASKSLSIDLVLGPLPKRLLFWMIKNADFTGSVDSNPYNFQHKPRCHVRQRTANTFGRPHCRYGSRKDDDLGLQNAV